MTWRTTYLEQLVAAVCTVQGLLQMLALWQLSKSEQVIQETYLQAIEQGSK